jgi:hypothetical protein
MVVADLQYVGILKEILVVTYSSLHACYFCCSWIPPNIWGSFSTICQDKHGFWLVNFANRLPPMEKPYVFLALVSQVSYNHIPMSSN